MTECPRRDHELLPEHASGGAIVGYGCTKCGYTPSALSAWDSKSPQKILRPQDSFPKEYWIGYAGELEKQIDRVKDRLIQLVSTRLYNDDAPNAIWESVEEKYREMARSRLAQEMPGIGWHQ